LCVSAESVIGVMNSLPAGVITTCTSAPCFTNSRMSRHDYKRDELTNIYKGKGTQKEKETVYDILFSINASQNSAWEKIKE
jgi:hypothetical protein